MSKDNIKKYRDKIDVIDKKILRLIQERASHAVSIGCLLYTSDAADES